ncbi:MAG: DUF1569 domain-containing protein [Gammaproteobacteria bacterium]
MNRRQALKILGATGLVGVGGGAFWLNRTRTYPELAVDLTLERLGNLNPEALSSSGSWSVARVFNHLAQSIEFSISGYPEMKSAAFQNTVGSLAFSVFQARGNMNHGLDEAIPGEVVDPMATSSKEALQRLIEAIQTFENFEGDLKPHFAYGELSKEQYSLAHVMHINNHWQEFSVSV